MADSGYTALIDPRDLRIYRVPTAKADVYRRAGWAAPDLSPAPREKEIQTHLSGWYENGQAAAFTFARGVPLAVSAIGKAVDKNTFENLAMKAQLFDTDHPLLSKVLQVGGGVATAAAVTAGAGALGGALGLGAEAAEAGALGSEAAGLGAEAAGAGAGEAAAGATAEGVGAAEGAAEGAATGAGDVAVGEAAPAAGELGAGGDASAAVRIPEVEAPTGLMRTDQLERFTRGLEPEITDAELVDGAETISGVPGVEAAEGAAEGAQGAEAGLGADAEAGAEGAEAAAGEGSGGFDLADFLSRAKGKVPTGKLAKVAALGAAENVAFGAAYRIDNQALEHALSPEGQEKLTFGANDILLDAAIGAGTPLGASVLGKSIGKLGGKLVDQSLSMFRSAVLKGHMVDAAISQGREGSLYRTLDPMLGKGYSAIVNTTTTAVKTAEQGLNVIKAKYPGLRLSSNGKEQILADIKRITGTELDPLYDTVARALRKKNIDIVGLQTLTKRIDKGPNIVWNDINFAANPRNLIARDVRNVLKDAQERLIESGGVQGAEDAIQWNRLNQISSDNQLILSSIAGRSGADLDQILRNIGTSAATGSLLGLAGLGAGGALASGLRTGGWQAVRHLKIQHVAPFVNKTGKFLLGVDARVAKVVNAGLLGVPGQAHKFYNNLDYDETAAAVSQAGADPAATIGNLQNSLNAQGIPQEFSLGIAQTQAAGLSHLKESIPKRNDAPDIATQETGDPVQQHRWLDQVKTFQDPTYGLANPTADNLRILKQFYPQTLFAAQQALYSQVAKNPSLPAEARTWASQLMERPLSNLDSPTFSQTLRQARQAAQGQPPPGSSPVKNAGGGSGNGVQSSLTRADQLQNR